MLGKIELVARELFYATIGTDIERIKRYSSLSALDLVGGTFGIKYTLVWREESGFDHYLHLHGVSDCFLCLFVSEDGSGSLAPPPFDQILAKYLYVKYAEDRMLRTAPQTRFSNRLRSYLISKGFL